MESKAQAAYILFQQQAGAEEVVGAWHQVDQKQIDAFAEATLDRQFIHIDPVRARELSPYKVTIAHGFLTLSLVTHLCTSVENRAPAAYEGVVMGINYGLDRVRFMAAVKVDSRIRARRKLLAVELKSADTLQLKHEVTVEIEGESKPACVAETLSRLIYG